MDAEQDPGDVTVCTLADEAVAGLLAGLLGEAGVPSRVRRSSRRGAAGPAAPPEEARWDVVVPSALLERAKGALRRLRDSGEFVFPAGALAGEASCAAGEAEGGGEAVGRKGAEEGGAAWDDEARLDAASARTAWFEVWVVFLALIFPALFCSLARSASGGEFWWGKRIEESAEACSWWIVLSISRTTILLYVIRRSGVPGARFGLVEPHILVDPIAGLFLSALAWMLQGMILPVVLPILGDILGPFPQPPPPTGGPTGTVHWILLSAAITLGAFYEELLFRGYLLARLDPLVRTPGIALFVSVAFFACGHAELGPPGLVGSAITGFVYGAVFYVFGRVWPLVVGHAAYDFVAMVLLLS
ncbi:MAG: CPBP family intramembrane glutamic endopeptidase [Planctomycetota bacterium]